MTHRARLTFLLVAPSPAARPHLTYAQWRINSVPVCTAANSQQESSIVSDGAGGAILAWQDDRNGNCDMYAQLVQATSAVDPAWPADDRVL